MAVYYVSYDLNQQGQRYEALLAQLNLMTSFALQKSAWLVDYDGQATNLVDELRVHFDENDTLFVDQVTGRWSGLNVIEAANWLDQRGL